MIVELEQISTSAHIASRMIYTAHSTYNDIQNCSIGDFGVGPGILSIASTILDCSYSIGFDVDQEALDSAWVNSRKLDIYSIDLIQADVQTLALSQGRIIIITALLLCKRTKSNIYIIYIYIFFIYMYISFMLCI